jgi:hypothetical protein
LDLLDLRLGLYTQWLRPAMCMDLDLSDLSDLSDQLGLLDLLDLLDP